MVIPGGFNLYGHLFHVYLHLMVLAILTFHRKSRKSFIGERRVVSLIANLFQTVTTIPHPPAESPPVSSEGSSFLKVARLWAWNKFVSIVSLPKRGQRIPPSGFGSLSTSDLRFGLIASSSLEAAGPSYNLPIGPTKVYF